MNAAKTDHLITSGSDFKVLITCSYIYNVCLSSFRLPHAFYPVQTNGYVRVSPGDKLAARCIMVNDQTRVIRTGPKDSDEMCIFYVMYYVESEKEPLESQVGVFPLATVFQF